MSENQATKRALRAIKTKKKLFRSAAKLIDRYGYHKVTIEDICKKAGVSVGAFYHYYASKSDIIVEFFKQIDCYYEETVEREFTGDAVLDVEIFFRYYAKFHVEQGCEHTGMIIKVQSDFFLDKTRYMHQKLLGLVDTAKQAGVFKEDADPVIIADFLLVVARGLLFDWVLARGEYDLVRKMDDYIRRAKNAF